ncbi:MAG: hypothetical protein P8L74_03275, partial [Gammaproteobacteria bacterium]|nr:hypothetical protein [Gammaproteobacteria bacterium]
KKTGQLKEHKDFVSIENGLLEIYYETGELEERRNVRDGLRHGLSEYFDKDGNLTKKETYSLGITSYFSD